MDRVVAPTFGPRLPVCSRRDRLFAYGASRRKRIRSAGELLCLSGPCVPIAAAGPGLSILWGSRGAFRVIVTASPEITVAPFARRLGAEALLGTPLVFDSGDRGTGAFAGPNCRGEEKVRRLRAAFGDDMPLAAAYGDTTGDTEMLAMADVAGFRRFKG